MSTLPQAEDFNAQLAALIATPSLSAYARALSAVDEVSELASSCPKTPNTIALLLCCDSYRALSNDAVARLTAQDTAREHDIYEAASTKHRRRGVLFDVDKGEHVVAALEALRLAEFLDEQENETRKVRFASSE